MVPKVVPSHSVVQDIVPVAAPKTTDASPSAKVSKRSTTTKSSVLETKKKNSSTVKLKPPPKEDKEDIYIAYLESKLGMDKGGKKKGKVAEEDGLEGMLQCCSIPYLIFTRVIMA